MTYTKDKVVALRLPNSVYENLEEIRKGLGLNKSQFYRELIISNSKKLMLPNNSFEEGQKKLLFYFNKSSNNINQIARQLNYLSKSGVIDKRLYVVSLENLNEVVELMNLCIKEMRGFYEGQKEN